MNSTSSFQDTQNPSLGLLTWLFIFVASLASLGSLYLCLPQIFDLLLENSGIDHNLVWELLLRVGIVIISFGMLYSASLLIKRHPHALQFTRFMLMISLWSPSFFIECTILLTARLQDDFFVFSAMLALNFTLTSSLYLFLKKKKVQAIIALAAYIIFLSLYQVGFIRELFISSLSHMTISVFPWLYYFTHSKRLQRVFPVRD